MTPAEEEARYNKQRHEDMKALFDMEPAPLPAPPEPEPEPEPEIRPGLKEHYDKVFRPKKVDVHFSTLHKGIWRFNPLEYATPDMWQANLPVSITVREDLRQHSRGFHYCARSKVNGKLYGQEVFIDEYVFPHWTDHLERLRDRIKYDLVRAIAQDADK